MLCSLEGPDQEEDWNKVVIPSYRCEDPGRTAKAECWNKVRHRETSGIQAKRRRSEYKWEEAQQRETLRVIPAGSQPRRLQSKSRHIPTSPSASWEQQDQTLVSFPSL
ncbi:hypothetical protein SAY86_027872 [Trapa natans]|uniref:Uncharacterized protein n=1 Tax=Trapa natans TaxID=22666 RepID=A0AAN7MGC2_TRANT|nr:hypothetical protein SAY86_027872 [Trapa natans]